MQTSTRAISRGARLYPQDQRWICKGQGHEVWVRHDPDRPQWAPEEAARLWLKMVETDDTFD